MAPKTDEMLIAVTSDLGGNFRLVRVIIQELPPLQLQRMRQCGQLDCGKRQACPTVQVSHLKSTTVDKLFEANLIDQDTELLQFLGPESKQDAEQAAKILLSTDPRFKITTINREIPCL